MNKRILFRAISVLLLIGYLLGFALLGIEKLKAFTHETEFVGVIINLPSRFHQPMSFYELEHLTKTVSELNSGPVSAQGVQGLSYIPNLTEYLGDQPSNVSTVISSLEKSQLRLAQSQLVELSVRVSEAHARNQTLLILKFIAGLIGCFLLSVLTVYSFRRPIVNDIKQPLFEPSSALAVALKDIGMQQSIKHGHDYVLELKGDDLLKVTDKHYSLIESVVCEMVSNSVAHGGRASAIRLAADKPSTIKVFVGIEKLDEKWKITVADDGEGLDEVAVMRQALAKQIVGEQALKGLEVGHGIKLILLDGYSDAKTNASGPLKQNSLACIRETVQGLGGAVSLRNRPSVFCEFTITLPLN